MTGGVHQLEDRQFHIAYREGQTESQGLRENPGQGGNKERMVMVHEDVLPYLEDWVKVIPQADRNFSFTSRDRKPLSVKAVRYLIQKHGRAARISEEKLHPHSFRHTFCVNLTLAGVPLHVIQELTGHKMLDTLRVYLKVTQRETDEIINRLPELNKVKKIGKPVFQ